MKKINIQKTLLLIAFLLLAVGIVLMAYSNVAVRNQNETSPETSDTSEDEEINLKPPTKEDNEEVEQRKQQLVEESNKQNTKPSSQASQTVNPIIGFVTQADNKNVEANGYISETVESGGICTLTLELDGEKVTATKTAMPDAQSTICGLITIDRSRLKPGEWKVTIGYESDKFKGISKERNIKVE